MRVVSIHAPAGGATEIDSYDGLYEARFNPRARGGRDPRISPITGHCIGFNPRARGGRDNKCWRKDL